MNNVVCKPNNVKQIALVGAGTIGSAWAAHFLAQGFDVMAADPSPASENKLRSVVDYAWPYLEQVGLAEGASRERLRFTTSISEAVEQADFIQESTPEREVIKDQVIADISHVAKPDVVIASSTSGIVPTRLQKRCKHPERFLVGHPFNPVYLMPLVEVVSGQQTSPETIQWAMDFYQYCGKTPLHCRKEIHGHLANRLQDAVQAEALQLIANGLATTAEIDAALTAGPGMRWALLGSLFTANMASEGGLADVLGGKFGSSYCSYAQGPELDAQTIEAMTLDIQGQVAGRSLNDMEQIRDEFLVGLIKLRADINAKYGFDRSGYSTTDKPLNKKTDKELV